MKKNLQKKTINSIQNQHKKISFFSVKKFASIDFCIKFALA